MSCVRLRRGSYCAVTPSWRQGAHCRDRFCGSAHNDTESENFLHFWDWLDTLITSCTRAGASMLAYCWHQAAENTPLRRIARHSPTLKSRVDSFITSGEWVDLERIFRATWITGDSTGLKAIAPLAGFSWAVEDPGGAIEMVRYTKAAAGSTDAQAWLTNYNRGDVEATLAIHEMLTRKLERMARGTEGGWPMTECRHPTDRWWSRHLRTRVRYCGFDV